MLLRQDNADARLTPTGHRLGLASQARLDRMLARAEALRATIKNIQTVAVTPAQANEYLFSAGTTLLSAPERLARVVLRPEVDLESFLHTTGLYDRVVVEGAGIESVVVRAEIALKYAGYVEREREAVDRLAALDELQIPPAFDFSAVQSITHEARQKLTRIRPSNVGQASRISVVSPADVQALVVLLRRRSHNVSRETSEAV